MPSDAKKREQQRKKEAAKARQTGKKTEIKPKDEKEEQNDVSKTNGHGNLTNGVTELSAEGNKYLFFYTYNTQILCK